MDQMVGVWCVIPTTKSSWEASLVADLVGVLSLVQGRSMSAIAVLGAAKAGARWRRWRLQTTLPFGAINARASTRGSTPATSWGRGAHHASATHACKVLPFNASTSGRTVQIDMFSLHHSTALSTWVWQPCMNCNLTAAMLCASVAHIKDLVDDLQSWHDTTTSHTSCRRCWSGESPGGPAGGGIMEPRSQRLLSATGGPPGPTPGGPPCAAPM